MDNNIKMYLPFAKKDNDERIVAGYATSEDLDSQGEVIKISAIKKALPDYMKFANIREMHQLSAVGKAIQATVDEGKKALYLVAKVVDKIAWEKCKEGVYNGFSIGGRILKKVDNIIEELSLSEISLVDRPANPSAVFSLVKIDSGKNVTDVNKQMNPTSVDEVPAEPKHTDVFRADRILQLAAELVYLYGYYESRGISTKQIDKAIEILKGLVHDELTRATEAKKADVVELLEEVVIDLEKKKLSGKDRKNMPSGLFAYIDSKGGKHLPIQDEAHVRNAIARFGQTQFESPAAKKTAARKILAAARRYNIEVSADSSVSQSAKKADFAFNHENWASSYFEQLQKVIG